MTEMMNFPERWEDFLHDYEFEDARRIYTNGSRLIPSFRVKQMMEHYAPVRHGRWEFPIFSDKVGYELDPRCKCSECGSVEMPLARHKFCPNCGAKMDGERKKVGINE